MFLNVGVQVRTDVAIESVCVCVCVCVSRISNVTVVSLDDLNQVCDELSVI